MILEKLQQGLVPEFPGAVAEDLLELERGQCLVRIGTDWTHTRTLPPAVKPAGDPTERITRAMREQFSAMRGQSDEAEPADTVPTEAEKAAFDEMFELVA